MTLLLKRLHFYAGVLVAPFLVVAAVSGGLYALAPTAEKLIYRTQLHTDSTGPPRSVADQIQAARTVVPGLTVAAARPGTRPGHTTAVLFDDPALPADTRRAVFVDPATLQLRGDLPVYGSTAALPLRTWVDELHRSLHLGAVGRNYSELAASWVWLIALAGLVLWITTARKKKRARGTAHLLTVDPGSAGRVRTLNSHAVVGLWLVVVLVFLSATGLTWSRYAGHHVTELRSALHWMQPALDTALPEPTGAPTSYPSSSHPPTAHPPTSYPPAGHRPASRAPASPGRQSPAPAAQSIAAANAGYADAALALARWAGVGDRGQAVEVAIPADERTAFTVTEVRAAGQFSPNTAVVDPVRQRVLAVDWFADWPVAAKLANLGVSLHMGILLGLASQLFLLAAMVTLVVVIVLGYRIWWERRPRGASRPGRAPSRGALRELPWPASRSRRPPR